MSNESSEPTLESVRAKRLEKIKFDLIAAIQAISAREWPIYRLIAEELNCSGSRTLYHKEWTAQQVYQYLKATNVRREAYYPDTSAKEVNNPVE